MTDHVDHASPRAPKRGLQKKIMIGAALAGMASIAGLAFAEWLATGTGEGYAKSRTAQALTTESVTASASLYPGGTGDLVIRIHNPNPFPVTLASVTPNGTITSDSPDCDAAGHDVTFTGVSGLSNVIGASATTDVTLTGALSMATTSANECQGVTFIVPVSLNGGSGGSGGGGGGGGDPLECDDGNPLTTDSVDGNMCTHTPVPDGTVCDDGDPNTGNDHSVNGVCVGVGIQTWYADLDGDGYGNPSSTVNAFSAPSGYVQDGSDCDDSDSDVYPGATEVFDGIDNDCDASIDDNAVDGQTFYRDLDLDGYGVSNDFVVAGTAPAGYSPFDGDCNDTNSSVNPAATEVVSNGVDDDCDGTIDEGA